MPTDKKLTVQDLASLRPHFVIFTQIKNFYLTSLTGTLQLHEVVSFLERGIIHCKGQLWFEGLKILKKSLKRHTTEH